MKKFLPPVNYVDDSMSTDDSYTNSCNASLEDFLTGSNSPSSSHDAVESLFIKNLEVAAKSESEFLPAGEPTLFRAANVDAEFMIDKRDELFRRDYIDRLTMMKIIRPQSQKSHQTIAIFDWDDTILPTSFLYYIGFDQIRNNPQMKALLNKLDKQAAKILEKAVRVGKTCIVTNAMKDWVETSSEMYLPLTHNVITNNDILIISARNEYEETYPNDPKRWKLETFLDLGENLQSSIPTNIIVMGDSEIEMDAALIVGRKFSQAMVKTIKFKHQPRPEELIKQHEVVLHKFDQIYTTLRSLSIKLEKKN